MKRADLLLTALLMAGLALAVSPPARTAPNQTSRVVVDPLDFRKPITPEQGLSEKYEGKVVRFTGTVQRASQDRRTKRHSYELHYDIVARKPGKDGKPVVESKETIVVVVSFAGGKELRGARQGGTVTVEGLGEVAGDGTLFIVNAEVVDALTPTK